MWRVSDLEYDVGLAAVYLAGPDGSYINGLNLDVDGGQTSHVTLKLFASQITDALNHLCYCELWLS